MAEPTLSEIVNISRDPGEGSVTPRSLINTQDLVHTVNQAAQFKAENDWRKYSSFMNDLKGTYKELGELQGLEVASADRPYLQRQMADILKKIADDPRAALGTGSAEIQKKLGQLRSQSAQSMQDKVYDDAHRMYLERDPSLQNDENKKIVEDYFKQPLGQRKPYMLKLPSLYNPEAIAKQINDSIPQKFSQTGLSPDGKYINTVSGIRYDANQFKTLADQMYNMPDSRGVVLSAQVADRFKSLPPSLQDAYKKKYPEDPVKGFFDETVMPWRKQDQIEKTEQKDDPFALQKFKQLGKLQELNVKFGFDKVLEEMKLGGQKELAIFKNRLKDISKKEQVGALKGMIDTQINSAIGDKNGVVYDFDSKAPLYELKVSPATLKMFSYTKGTGSDKESIQPDNLMVSEDGRDVRVTFYKKGDDGSFELNSKGQKTIDETKTKHFSKEEYMARFGKDILGVSATEKEINSDDEEGGGGTGGYVPGFSSSNKTKIPGF